MPPFFFLSEPFSLSFSNSIPFFSEEDELSLRGLGAATCTGAPAPVIVHAGMFAKVT
jgi:hypothetical protein